ncbi:MAG: SMI1/KNR4 family protein [Terriglobales bacterium]
MRIQENVARLSLLWAAFPPVEDVSAFDPVEDALGIPLPADYKFFLMWSNGGSTLEPLPHCRLYPLEQLLPRRADGQPQGVLEVGTDDSLGFALDLTRGRHSASYRIVSYPLGDRGREDLEDVALTFNGFISSWFQDAELKRREGA